MGLQQKNANEYRNPTRGRWKTTTTCLSTDAGRNIHLAPGTVRIQRDHPSIITGQHTAEITTNHTMRKQKGGRMIFGFIAVSEYDRPSNINTQNQTRCVKHTGTYGFFGSSRVLIFQAPLPVLLIRLSRSEMRNANASSSLATPAGFVLESRTIIKITTTKTETQTSHQPPTDRPTDGKVN